MEKNLLDVMACPKCKGNIKYDKQRNKIICSKCRLRFNIENDMPDMIIEDAETF